MSTNWQSKLFNDNQRPTAKRQHINYVPMILKEKHSKKHDTNQPKRLFNLQ